MAFSVLGVAVGTGNLPLVQGTTYQDLVTPFSITATGGNVQFIGYARGASPDTWLQILVDGVQVAVGQGDPDLNSVATSVSAGTHMVSFQALKPNDDTGFVPTIAQRGLTVLALS